MVEAVEISSERTKSQGGGNMKFRILWIFVLLLWASSMISDATIQNEIIFDGVDVNSQFYEEDLQRYERMKTMVGKMDFHAEEIAAPEERNENQAEAENRYVVQFNESVNLDELHEKLLPYDYSLLGYSEQRMIKITLEDPEAFKNEFGEGIKYFEKDHERYSTRVTNDTYVDDQWALEALNLPEAWGIETGSSEVVVSVIDSGIQRGFLSHSDHDADMIMAGWDYVLDKPQVESDSTGHGTMVTGVISAVANNNMGIAGVIRKGSIIPLKVTYSTGAIYTSDVIEAILDAAYIGSDIIKISLGGLEYSSLENDVIQYAAGMGSLVVASAGNYGEDPLDGEKKVYPASYDNVISVGSLNENGTEISDFSQRNNRVDVAAPGENILTTLDYYEHYNNNWYGYVSGTSFSAPYVSGIAALAKSVDSGLTINEFQSLLQETSVDILQTGKDNSSGWGVIDAYGILYEMTVVDVTGVEINPTTMELTAGGSAGTLSVTVLPRNATNKAVVWQSSNSGVATVKNGVVTPLAQGTATISVTTVEGGFTASCTVTVNPVPEIEVTASSSIADGTPGIITVQLSNPVPDLDKSNFTVTKNGLVYVDFTVSSSDTANYELVMGDAATSSDSFTITISKSGYAISGSSVTNNVEEVATYVVEYHDNGATLGSVPIDTNEYAAGDSLTVASAGNLQKDGWLFIGWNTKIDGSGETFLPGSVLTMASADLVLYAEWTQNVNRAADITKANVLIVGQYVFELGNPSFTLNNYLTAAKTVYTNGDYNEIYYFTGIKWYDLVASDELGQGLVEAVVVDPEDINGDGSYTYWNMSLSAESL
jgi:uncharacterized protein YjdB